MIYRVLIDYRRQVSYAARLRCRLTAKSFRALVSHGVPARTVKRLAPLQDKPFEDQDQFMQAVSALLEPKTFEAYWETIYRWAEKEDAPDRRTTLPWDEPTQRLIGASYGWLAEIMFQRGLVAPEIATKRARFYFTERGWAQVGQEVAAEAKRVGYIVKVIRRKQPNESQVVYRDELQVAILPAPRRRPAPSAKESVSQIAKRRLSP